MLVLMETTTPELPRGLQDAAAVTPVARPVVSSPTPAIHLAYGETMASIGQGVVDEAPCVALVEVAAEQLLEAIYIVQLYLSLLLCRGWAWWCASAALALGYVIVI